VISSNAKVGLGMDRKEGRWLRQTEPGIMNAEHDAATTSFNQSVVQAGRLWLLWNERIERVADLRYRVEDTSPRTVCALAQFSPAQCGADAMGMSVEVAPGTPGPSPELLRDKVLRSVTTSWQVIASLDDPLEKDLRAMSARYG
jgi:hypothetical protein